MSFYGGIQSYDVHTYWNNNNPQETKFASDLRERVQEEFAQEIAAGDIRVYKFWDKPIGPHPINMWELDFKSPEIFAKVVPWFQLNHGKLSVLIHPRSGKGDLLDHTTHALWLGHKVQLDKTFLE
ncbi:dopa 4,5-dioxygenase [Suhomyces tanzawaensis NRRL Y-17324]|uniref:Dopa 4,5-dioxygenase n=1 Tax=Suhomyces tanzawaensis NRRL Y-17324 TaxID=984487 RepID=A0A1E4SEK7_9ASCO|nr:dopa 4,5-dioxygenase [Suhomyces tanzawaensis NRRL Y-17324]ODV77910.1 dopa 4,5-dioxygenase [Suhomyces tanzawaensis NRRL Y-17324]